MAPTWTIPKGAQWLAVNDYPLTYQDAGSGPPLVLVHGTIVDHRIWQPQIAELSRTCRVIAPSLRHYFPERWDRVGDDFSIEQHARDVIGLVKALKLGKIHLLGWSRGGLVAVEVARRSPEMIKTLIFEDATIDLVGNDSEQSRIANDAAGVRLQNLKTRLLRGDDRRGTEEFIDAINGAGAWARLAPAHQQVMIDNIHTALAADVRNPVPREFFSRLSAPTLLITGENSPRRYAALYDELHKLRNFGPTVVVPNAAHLMHLENAQAFNAAVSAFVAAK
jgi:pimeloyl-ACP methyl ester carboxylesterase